MFLFKPATHQILSIHVYLTEVATLKKGVNRP
jgi:hypothetical protein